MAAPRTGLVALALVIVYIVWGSTYLGIRVVVEEAPPLTSMGMRYGLAGLLLGAFIAARRGVKAIALTRKQVVGTAFLGLCLPLLGNGMVSVAEDHGATSGFTALLIAVAPLVIVIFRAIEHDMPNAQTLAGVLLGFTGLAVLVLLGRGAGDFALGPALLILFSSSCWAFGSYVQPRLWLPANPFVVAVWEMVFGGLMMVILGLSVGESFTFDYAPKTWFALSYLVIFGSVVAFTAYVWLVANAPISLVATYAYVNPVIAVFLGWLILDEKITWPIAAGGAIVVASVALVITSERKHPPAAAAPAEPPVVEQIAKQ
ncbi:drug/metabolite exporter YedA [Aeromicrobium panaciterrae]|uniref:EamA family transporter n=1 Tax=Aeromicrobium panaciterrae TaxID=363861 RepID=UPI0031D1D016